MGKEKSKIDVQTIGTRGADGKKKLTIVLVIVIVVAVMVNVIMAKGTESEAVTTDNKPSAVPMTPDGLEKQSFESETQSAIKSLREGENKLRASIQENQKDLKSLDQNQKDFRKEMGSALSRISMQLDDLKSAQQAMQDGQANASQTQDMGEIPPPDSPDTNIPSVPPPPTFGGKPKHDAPTYSGGGATSVAPVKDKDAPIVLTPPKEMEEDDKVKVSVEREGNSYAGWLSPGFLPVVTLTGVQAGTASTSQQNPSPMLMRVQGNATLPGSAEYELHGCFITGTSYGDARTHRAITDIATISCVDKDERLVLEETLTGYVVDSDGIEGLRGTLKEKRGAVLAKATLASMLEGLGKAFGDAQGTAFDSVTGGGTILNGSDALKSSGLNAASAGAKTLSDFYLQEVERLFPVIEVPPNRKATVIITKGKSLKWHDSGALFTKKTTPQ